MTRHLLLVWLTVAARLTALLAAVAGLGHCDRAEVPISAERASAGYPLAEHHIWIDTDLVISSSGTIDPDDLIALEMLRRAPGVATGTPIAGLSASAANGTLQQTRRAVREHATWLPEVAGINGRIDADCPLQLPGTASMTVLALGPATNLPQLIDCFRRSGTNVVEVVFVGGRRRGEEFRLDGRSAHYFRPMRDLNFEADRQAFRDLLATEALSTGTRLTLIPFAAGNAVRLSLGDVAPVLRDGADFAAVRNWIASLAMVGGDWTMPGFDPAAAAYLLWPEKFLCEPVTVDATGSNLLLVDGGAGLARRCLPQRPGEIVARIRDMLRRPIPE